MTDAPFEPQLLEEERAKAREKRETFTVSINPEERKSLDEAKQILKQPKDSTAIKQLAEIGAIVLHDEKMRLIIGSIFKNKYNNKRSGIPGFE